MITGLIILLFIMSFILILDLILKSKRLKLLREFEKRRLKDFESLYLLEDGWFDGEGKSISKENLDFLAFNMIIYFNEFSFPYVYPTPNGGVRFEWKDPQNTSLEFNFEKDIIELHMFSLNYNTFLTFEGIKDTDLGFLTLFIKTWKDIKNE